MANFLLGALLRQIKGTSGTMTITRTQLAMAVNITTIVINSDNRDNSRAWESKWETNYCQRSQTYPNEGTCVLYRPYQRSEVSFILMKYTQI